VGGQSGSDVARERRSSVGEAEAPSGEAGGGRVEVALYTSTFKIDGSVAAPAPHDAILKAGEGPIVVYDCKVYDRLQKDKFIFGMSRMELGAGSVEIALPRDAVTKEGVF